MDTSSSTKRTTIVETAKGLLEDEDVEHRLAGEGLLHCWNSKWSEKLELVLLKAVIDFKSLIVGLILVKWWAVLSRGRQRRALQPGLYTRRKTFSATDL